MNLDISEKYLNSTDNRSLPLSNDAPGAVDSGNASKVGHFDVWLE